MTNRRSLDALVRARLQEWPQCPPGLERRRTRWEGWLRGRPTDERLISHPFLKLPGSNRMRTLPDGLWLNFGGKPEDAFVDIFAVEACSTLVNLLDKRSRFAPSTHSMLAVCPVSWLLGPVSYSDPTPRWRVTGVLTEEPTQPLVLPVRDIRVLYALLKTHYQGFLESQVPHPHEYFVPMDSIVAHQGHQDPALQELVSRASAAANFLPTR